MTARYVILPKADQDLNDQAYYLATQANPRVGHNFLLAAHETFSLLATQPNMGWHSRLKSPALASLRVFRVSGFERLLVLYRPRLDGAEILRVVHASRDLEAFLRRDRAE
ncbi:MAG TPA: type II toxin-antitoxin system RelE/ParE family toxin [Terriglobia bacterium]|nr:type II toxin-antitoxin system RelE/ParE family toxin [Terriglobia bacterium]